MKSVSLNARMLRIILVVSLLLLAGCGIAGFYYMQTILRKDAMEISALNTEAAASEGKITALINIQKYLEEHKDDQLKAAEIVAESKQYKYQNEIIDAVSAIASKSGVTVSSYTFNEAPTGAGGAATPPAAQPTPAPTTPTTPDAAAAGGAGAATPAATLNSKTVTVAIKNPVDYKSLMSFIRRIEQNNTKMQIANVSISRATSEGGEDISSSVTTNAFEIEVYVK